MINNLPYPFNVAFDWGHSIDYRCEGGKDHAYVKERGFESKMNSDCSYSAPGLRGFSLSSYGDWGTFYVDWAGDREKEMFLDMVEKGLIKIWRIKVYIQDNKHESTHDYYYDKDKGGWVTYDNKQNKWIACPDPFRKKKEQL